MICYYLNVQFHGQRVKLSQGPVSQSRTHLHLRLILRDLLVSNLTLSSAVIFPSNFAVLNERGTRFLIHFLLNGRWIESYRWAIQYEKECPSMDLSFKRHYEERGVSGCLCWAGYWSFFRHNIKKPAGEHSLLSIRVWECSILEKCLPRRPPAPLPFHFVLILCWIMTIAIYSLEQNSLLHK